MEIREILRGLLENHELQEGLVEAFATGADSPEVFHSIDLADHIRHARGIAVSETPFENLPNSLEEVIKSFVIERLPQPAPITLEDLTSLAITHLAGIESSEPNEDAWCSAYKRFVNFALAEIELERPSWPDPDVYFELGDVWTFEFVDGQWTPFSPRQPQSPESPVSDTGFALSIGVDGRGSFGDMWSSGTGFRLSGVVIPALPNHPTIWENCRLLGKLQGFCSEAAMQQAVARLQGVIESISKTVIFSEGSWGNWARLSSLVNGHGRLMMSTCLTAIWDRPENAKDELLYRLRNAIVLLSQADEIALEPVALSLAFSAIEALVCEKDEVPINKQVKRHVATLLVQDAASRKTKEQVINNIYDIRSKVLHGSKINWSNTEDINAIARTIAAGVILAISCWRDNQLRTGGETSWKELMDELNAASRKPSEMVGVPDLSLLIEIEDGLAKLIKKLIKD